MFSLQHHIKKTEVLPDQTIRARLGPLACVQWSHSLGRLHHREDLFRGHGGEHPDLAPGDPVMAPTLGKPNAHQVMGKLNIYSPSGCPRVHVGGETTGKHWS